MSLRKQKMLAGWAVLLLAALACNITGESPEAVEAAIQTLSAQQTLTAQAAPPEAPPPEQPQVQPPPGEEATLTPSPSPTIALSATTSIPMVSVSVNTNCRSGPGVGYALLDSLVVGQQVQITQRAPQGFNYVLINRPNGGGECWLWLQYATITGDTSNLPVATPPPSPTPTFTPTFTATVTITPTPAPGTISGIVYDDINGNNTQDGGESGFPAITIFVGQGACASIGLTGGTTNINGQFSFPDIPAGEYCVTVDLSPIVCPTSPLEKTITVTAGNTTNVSFPCN
ncbi:MAG: hypothetical protein DWQ07_06835 [Chloroflexi bacterium]|nr:MAG: hypothetical protein DWQ07_06835 [Chloroflexota bacterium]MBL1195584.1 hypothetical protein [Chloroflexota bacterium]NOH12870.1 hypothetical protein [Chloroflexota bacterium]